MSIEGLAKPAHKVFSINQRVGSDLFCGMPPHSAECLWLSAKFRK